MNTKYPIPPVLSTPATSFHPLPLFRSLLFPPQYSRASSFPVHSLFLLFFSCSFMLTVSWNLSASPSSAKFSPTINFYTENKHTAAFFTHTHRDNNPTLFRYKSRIQGSIQHESCVATQKERQCGKLEGASGHAQTLHSSCRAQ